MKRSIIIIIIIRIVVISSVGECDRCANESVSTQHPVPLLSKDSTLTF
jgi:hypothetical protein